MELRNYYPTECNRNLNRGIQVYSRYLSKTGLLHVVDIYTFANFTTNMINMVMPRQKFQSSFLDVTCHALSRYVLHTLPLLKLSNFNTGKSCVCQSSSFSFATTPTKRFCAVRLASRLGLVTGRC